MRQAVIKQVLAGAATLALLGACSEAGDSSTAPGETMEAVTEAPAAEGESAADSVAGAKAGEASIPDLGEVAVSVPKLAYVYDFAFRLAGEEIGPLQLRHADLCEQQGPSSCRILGMTKSGEEGETVTGQLQMAVATKHARAFGALLEDEELSKAIVDTEAQLAARTELRDRLMQVLRTRKGSVSELVEAERSVAQVNEEIDQARSWLKEMQGRVAYSTVTVRYESGGAIGGDFLAPIQSAMGSLGSVAGFVVAALMLLGAAALPVVALVLGSRAINRRWSRRPAEA
jgi:hypothetical protein